MAERFPAELRESLTLEDRELLDAAAGGPRIGTRGDPTGVALMLGALALTVIAWAIRQLVRLIRDERDAVVL